MIFYVTVTFIFGLGSYGVSPEVFTILIFDQDQVGFTLHGDVDTNGSHSIITTLCGSTCCVNTI